MNQSTHNQWQLVPIKILYEGLFDGPHATPKPAKEGPVFLGIKNITDDGKLDLSDIRHIAEEDYPQWTRRVVPKAGDIVFTYEATLNRYAIIPKGFKGCLGRRLALIRPKHDEVDYQWLFYYFLSDEWRRTVARNTLHGSTVDRLPLTNFADFEVRRPPLPTQKKIAAILSAYDDLIENNFRRIRILEEMAQALYREWFVKFCFPGHQKVKVVDSPLGKIPEGWEVSELSRVSKIVDCLHSKKPSEAIIPSEQHGILLHIWNIPGGGRLDLSKKFFINEEDYGVWTKNIEVMEGDCVITNVGRVGDFAQIPRGVKAAIGRNMTAVRPIPEGVSPTFLIEYLRSPFMDKERAAKVDRGTIMDSLNVKGIVKLLVPMPPKELMEQFENLAYPLRLQAQILQEKIGDLRQIRDLLLPKLISGELDVSELDIKTAESE